MTITANPFYITCDADLKAVEQAVADYENRLAGGDLGCGPAEPEPAPPPMSSQQLRSLANIREREEQAERGEKPPIAWCGLGHDKYEDDLEAARRLAETKQQADKGFNPGGETLGEQFSAEAWEHIKEAAKQLREHRNRGYQEGLEAGKAQALAERNNDR